MSMIIRFIIILLVITTNLFSVSNNKNEFENDIILYKSYFENIPNQKGNGFKPFKRWENFYENRFTGEIPLFVDILKQIENIKNIKNSESLLLTSYWKSIGPNYVPKNKLPYKSSGNGRINCLAFDPLYSNVIWAGSASGGIWKSNDAGATWVTFPFTQFMSIGISDIAINPKDPKIVYAATGDADGSFMTRGYTIGIIKTTDGGYNWQVTNFQKQIQDNVLISKIIINSDNPEILLIATTIGIFKSTDGGNTWNNKLPGLSFKELITSSDNQNILFATTFNPNGNTAIYKSIDNGENWIKNYDLPNVNRSAIGISQSSPNRIYLVASNFKNNSLEGFYLSTDKGVNWTKSTSNPNLLSQDYKGEDNIAQGNYDLSIVVNPNNSAEVWVGGINIWKSTDGGYNWTIATHWSGDGGAQFVHADHHDLVFDKNGFLFSANDGGIYNTQNNGKNWFDVSKNLCVTQVYRLDIDENNSNRLILGCQDNGTFNLVNGTFEHITGGDGMDCKLDLERDSVFYNSIYYGTIYKTDGKNVNHTIFNTEKSGENSEWSAPIKLNPKNSKIVYIGHQNLWRSDDGGDNFYKISNFNSGTIHNIAISEIDTSVIYFSTGKDIYKTSNNGQKWRKVFSGNNSNISSIDIHNKNSEILFVTFYGYTSTEKVMQIENDKIRDLTLNLPNIPINCLQHQNNTEKRLYIGTDIGVFVLDSNSWQLFNNKLPNIVINDLKINEKEGIIFAGTFGRGVWSSNIPICQETNPTFEIIGDTITCEPNNIKLKLNNKWNKIFWNNSSFEDSITITKSGKYFAYVENENGCRYKTRVIEITVHPLPKLRIFTDNYEFCAGDSIEIFATAGFQNYLWSNNDTTFKIEVYQPGKFFCKGITNNGCINYSDTINILMNPSPEKPIITRIGNTLIAPSGFKYQWYFNNSKILNANNKEYKIDKLGSYRLEILDSNNCHNYSDYFEVISNIDDKSNLNSISLLNKILSVNLNNYLNSIIEIYNFQGQIVQKHVFISQIEINLNNFEKGVYFIKIYTLGEIIYSKILNY